MITFVNHPALQSEDSLVQLYHNFISSFETKYVELTEWGKIFFSDFTDLSFRINPYGLVEIVSVIVSFIADKKEAVEFLEKLKEKVKICDEAVWFCRVSTKHYEYE